MPMHAWTVLPNLQCFLHNTHQRSCLEEQDSTSALKQNCQQESAKLPPGGTKQTTNSTSFRVGVDAGRQRPRAPPQVGDRAWEIQIFTSRSTPTDDHKVLQVLILSLQINFTK